VQLTNRLRSGLIRQLTSGPVIVIALEGNDAVASTRKIAGATSPIRADPGTLRGMYSTDSYQLAEKKGRSVMNLVHVSDNPSDAEMELHMWFTKNELLGPQ
jgi:nucleoside-diphosphate kinase